MDKATPTLRQRCDTALQSLPDAPYRAMLAALFDEMLAEVERLAAQAAGAPAVRMLTDGWGPVQHFTTLRQYIEQGAHPGAAKSPPTSPQVPTPRPTCWPPTDSPTRNHKEQPHDH